MSALPLHDTLRALTEHADALTGLLEAEREAIVARDLPALDEILTRKSELVEHIGALRANLGSTPLVEKIAATETDEREELERLHRSLVASAEKARDYNAVNGKIVHRAQQSTRELIHLISGTDADMLYGEQGQTTASAKGTAIARA